jgi:ribosomal-protein-alanine N-acetyltransferase
MGSHAEEEDSRTVQRVDFYRNLPRLETERLVLRRLTVEDADDYFEFASDSEVTRFLRWGPHPNKEHTLGYLQGVLDEYSKGEDGPWGIELKTPSKVIGIVHLMQLDTHHKKAQIGFVLARAHWGTGYMTEALNAVLEYVFTELQLNRIEALSIVGNRAAVRAMERVGMRAEGVLRQYAFQKGDFVDFELFSTLATGYRTHRRA